MAKPAKIPEKTGTIHEDDAGVGHNSRRWDDDVLRDVVNRIENVQSQIDGIMDDAKAECQPLRDDIKEIKREAADNGIDKKELAAVLRTRRFLAKAEAVPETLDDHQTANYDTMREQLGMLAETPLGASALEAVKEKAHQHGFAAARGGRGATAADNPYSDPASEEHKAWEAGRQEGEAKTLSEMKPENAAA